MGAVLIKTDFELFSIDHDRDNNPNKNKVAEEVQEELAHLREMILQKFVLGELTVISLNRMLNRVNDLTYFLGRLDGEKYKEGIK